MSELTQAPRICLTFTFHPSRAVVSNNNYLVPQWQSAGDVRLVNGTSPSNGVVQLYLDLKNGRAGWASECSQLSQVAIELIEGSYHIGYYVTNPPDPSTGTGGRRGGVGGVATPPFLLLHNTQNAA